MLFLYYSEPNCQVLIWLIVDFIRPSSSRQQDLMKSSSENTGPAVMLHSVGLMALVFRFAEANDALCSYLFALQGNVPALWDVFNRLWLPVSVDCENSLHVISPRPRFHCCYSNRDYKRFINSQLFCQSKGSGGWGVFTLTKFTFWGN